MEAACECEWVQVTARAGSRRAAVDRGRLQAGRHNIHARDREAAAYLVRVSATTWFQLPTGASDRSVRSYITHTD